MKAKNNAPSDWNPTGAANKCGNDSSTFLDDMRVSWRALGAGELLRGIGEPRELLGSIGVALVGIGWLLLLGVVL